MNEKDFEQWLDEVDNLLDKEMKRKTSDYPNYDWLGDFLSGCSPEDCLVAFLANNFYF